MDSISQGPKKFEKQKLYLNILDIYKVPIVIISQIKKAVIHTALAQSDIFWVI